MRLPSQRGARRGLLFSRTNVRILIFAGAVGVLLLVSAFDQYQNLSSFLRAHSRRGDPVADRGFERDQLTVVSAPRIGQLGDDADGRGDTTAGSPRALSDARWLDDTAQTKLSDRRCVCPQMTRCDDRAIETRCLDYLGDAANVATVRFRPPPSMATPRGLVARAARFTVQYQDPCVVAIAKAATEALPLAPESEYFAFDADRAMGFDNVPPTTVLFIALTQIVASTRTPAESHWLERMVVRPALARGAVINHTFDDARGPQQVLYVSVQLLLFSARTARATPFQADDALLTLLRSNALMHRAVHYIAERKSKARQEDAVSAHRATNDAGMGDMVLRHLAAEEVSSLLLHFEDLAKARLRGVPTADAGRDFEPIDAAARGEILSDESARVARLLRQSRHLHKHTIVPLLQTMSDRALFDALVGSDVGSSVHGGEAPLQSSTAFVYLLRPQNVPDTCIGWLQAARHALLLDRNVTANITTRPRDAGEAAVLLQGSVAAAGGDAATVSSVWTSDLAAAIGVVLSGAARILRPLWLDHEGAFRRRGLLGPAFRGTDPTAPGSVCLLRPRTWGALTNAARLAPAPRGIAESMWCHALRRRVPAPLLRRVGSERVCEWVAERLTRAASHQEACSTALGGSRFAVLE